MSPLLPPALDELLQGPATRQLRSVVELALTPPWSGHVARQRRQRARAQLRAAGIAEELWPALLRRPKGRPATGRSGDAPRLSIALSQIEQGHAARALDRYGGGQEGARICLLAEAVIPPERRLLARLPSRTPPGDRPHTLRVALSPEEEVVLREAAGDLPLAVWARSVLVGVGRVLDAGLDLAAARAAGRVREILR